MLYKNNIQFIKSDKKDYFIRVNSDNKKAIFRPYFKGKYKSFFYDFNIDKCRLFHKNACSYSILDLSLDGTKAIISFNNPDSNGSLYNKVRIIEIGTNKILSEIDDEYTYEAYFTANPRYIFCRNKQFNKMSISIYDIEKNKSEYTKAENIFIRNGSFDNRRNFFIYPSLKEEGTIKVLNFLTLNETKVNLNFLNIKISSLKALNERDMILVENNKYIYFYSGGKIVWKVDIAELNTDYEGSIFYLDRKIYLDTPAIVDIDDNDGIKKKERVLFRIDENEGALEHIILPSNIEYRKFTPLFDYKIIDTFGNIYDVRTKKDSMFPISHYM